MRCKWKENIPRAIKYNILKINPRFTRAAASPTLNSGILDRDRWGGGRRRVTYTMKESKLPSLLEAGYSFGAGQQKELSITTHLHWMSVKYNLSTWEIGLPYVGKSHTSKCTILSTLSALPIIRCVNWPGVKLQMLERCVTGLTPLADMMTRWNTRHESQFRWFDIMWPRDLLESTIPTLVGLRHELKSPKRSTSYMKLCWQHWQDWLYDHVENSCSSELYLKDIILI